MNRPNASSEFVSGPASHATDRLVGKAIASSRLIDSRSIIALLTQLTLADVEGHRL